MTGKIFPGSEAYFLRLEVAEGMRLGACSSRGDEEYSDE